MGKIKSSKVNYATPGQALTQKEFEQMLHEAEKGPFHSLKAVNEEVSKWKARHSK